MFSDQVIYRAAHVIYSSEFADALEHRGGSFSGEITSQVDELTPAEHDEIIRPLLEKIDAKLGAPLEGIFKAGGIVDEDQQYDALSDLLMGVRGHGVSIQDRYGPAWKRGCQLWGTKGELPYDEMNGYYELAHEKLDASGYPAEDDETNENEPYIETAFAWHGGQDHALYAFASTRMVQSETHRAATLDEIDANIDWHKVNEEQEPGDVAKLQRLRAAVADAKIGVKFFYK